LVIALSLSRSSACGNTVFRDFQDFFPFFPALEFTELNFLMRRVGVDRIELVALGQGWIEADIFLPLVKESIQSSNVAILCAMISSCSVGNDAALEERDRAVAKV
jgi:hypothetical protein